MTETIRELSGSCLCGEVKYVAEGTPERFYHCHCNRCRKATGTGHASNLFVKGTLRWETGEALVQRFRLPEAERFTNSFCSQCGSRLPMAVEAQGMVFIPAGSLDQEPEFTPQARIFQGSRAQWSCDTQSIQAFDAYPD